MHVFNCILSQVSIAESDVEPCAGNKTLIDKHELGRCELSFWWWQSGYQLFIVQFLFQPPPKKRQTRDKVSVKIIYSN